MRGKYDKSIDILKKGMEISPDSVGLRVNLATTLITIGDYMNALRILEGIPEHERKMDGNIMRLLLISKKKSLLD